uniref:MADS-box domain-containing protein n=1 Tax=Setaria italica TaxID=4555 RepID=K3Y395_SETIT
MTAPEAEAESVCGEAGGERKRKKKTLGRQKIEIKLIESRSARYVCFSKRHDGLFKNAVELAARCGAHVAIVVFSRAGKPYSIGYPSVNPVVDRYLDPASASAAAPCAAAVARLAPILREYESEKERLEKAMKAEVIKRKALDAAARAAGVRAADDDVCRAGIPELLAMLAALERVQAEAAERVREATVEEVMMQHGAGSSHPDPGAMDAQTTMLMGGDVDHAPMHFASMMLPTYYLPPPPLNYGSNHNQLAGYGYNYDLGDGSGHDAANELEGYYYYGTTTTCNFFG